MRPTRWAFPVASPWTARRYGRPVALLSARQHELHWLIRLTIAHGPRTLEELARDVDNPSRGRVHSELRRLRQLELIGTYARRGRHGRTYLWIPRATRAFARSLAGQRLPRGNDSASTPTGSYLSAKGLIGAFVGSDRYRGGAPPRTPRRSRGHRAVPRFLWGACPLGHRLRLIRWSYALTPTTLEGRWGAACPRCGREAVEHVMAVAPLPARRDPSPDELVDPSRLARRELEAAAWLADPGLNPEIRARLAADYGSRDQEAAGG